VLRKQIPEKFWRQQLRAVYRLDRLEASPVPKFLAGLDFKPSLSSEMTVAPHHSTIGTEVVTGPFALRRS